MCIAPCSDGQIKLIEGSPDNYGRVEICSNQRWETLSSNYWQYEETRVACNALGYTGVYILCNENMCKVILRFDSKVMSQTCRLCRNFSKHAHFQN